MRSGLYEAVRRHSRRTVLCLCHVDIESRSRSELEYASLFQNICVRVFLTISLYAQISPCTAVAHVSDPGRRSVRA